MSIHTDARHVADQYLENTVENAPPVKLVRMLVEGAVKFLDRALLASPQTDRKAFVHWTNKADNIVVELRLSLIPVAGSDVAPNLERLYLFCEERIGLAQSNNDHAPLREARKVLAVLLDAWMRVENPEQSGTAA
ncbi:MAG: flagellar protein FliS [Planctomycetes bacterium]|nr:flagellar protein FliS [Planctomycetota bacterium]